ATGARLTARGLPVLRGGEDRRRFRADYGEPARRRRPPPPPGGARPRGTLTSWAAPFRRAARPVPEDRCRTGGGPRLRGPRHKRLKGLEPSTSCTASAQLAVPWLYHAECDAIEPNA